MVGGEERKARNEALFREANEEIRAAQSGLGLESGRMPFLCECDDESCHVVVRLTPEEYERIRSEPTRFLVVPGHSASSHSEVVEEHGGWSIVEKHGVAGQVARAEDPRAKSR